MLVRSFLPVGQGAFCCECFEMGKSGRSLNVVYDCGSTTGVKYVEREISKQFEQGDIIDAIFISHLDEDHVNGLPYLLTYCKVNKIYLPLVSSDDKAMMKVQLEIKGITGVAYNFLDNPYRAIRELGVNYDLELVQIGSSNDDWNNNNIRRINSGENVYSDIMGHSIKNVVDFEDEWLYVPFNFRQDTRKQQLLDEVEKEFGKRFHGSDLGNLWKNGTDDDRKKIKEAYKRVPGNLNTNSMTVFSGKMSEKLGQKVIFYGIDWRGDCLYSCHYKTVGCLYTGDYDASGIDKWRDLKDAYAKYWKYIGCVQVPHHGSNHNFNEELLELDAFYVISAGSSNRYSHPHSAVLKKFIMNRIMPVLVTENEWSGIHMIVG